MSKQTIGKRAEVSREKIDIQKSHVISPHSSITLITPSSGRMGAHQRVKWKCHGGQPWEFRSGQSLFFHIECDGERPALMNKTWSIQAAGTRAVHLPFARLAKAKQEVKGEQKSIQCAGGIRRGCRGGTGIRNRGFDQIVLRLGVNNFCGSESSQFLSTGTRRTIQVT